MGGSTILSDDILVQKARGGDRTAFDALVLRYQLQAVLVARSVLQNVELAKDASQNAFAKAYFGLKSFRADSSFKTWLFRILVNEARDVRRREQARGLFHFWTQMDAEGNRAEDILEIIPSRDRSPEETVEAEETRKRIGQAVRKLPEREREVFVLRYFQDLSLSEVGEIMGIAVGTVKAHLAHGLERLKSMLRVQSHLASERWQSEIERG